MEGPGSNPAPPPLPCCNVIGDNKFPFLQSYGLSLLRATVSVDKSDIKNNLYLKDMINANSL